MGVIVARVGQKRDILLQILLEWKAFVRRQGFISMPTVHRQVSVPYSTAQMFDLVNDVDRYKEFVPWCVKSSVLSKTEDEIRATLAFAGGGIEKGFTTLNRIQSGRMIEIRLIDGPFRQLEGFWRFEEHADVGSTIVLDLEFEFSSTMLKIMFGPVFTQVASTLVDAFAKRAQEIYA